MGQVFLKLSTLKYELTYTENPLAVNVLTSAKSAEKYFYPTFSSF